SCCDVCHEGVVNAAPLCAPMRRPPTSTLLPYTTLFRSWLSTTWPPLLSTSAPCAVVVPPPLIVPAAQLSAPATVSAPGPVSVPRSEDHTSELESPRPLVCRRLLETNNPYTAPMLTPPST